MSAIENRFAEPMIAAGWPPFWLAVGGWIAVLVGLIGLESRLVGGVDWSLVAGLGASLALPVLAGTAPGDSWWCHARRKCLLYAAAGICAAVLSVVAVVTVWRYVHSPTCGLACDDLPPTLSAPAPAGSPTLPWKGQR